MCLTCEREVEIITRVVDLGKGLCLWMKRGNFLLKTLGWMTSQVGWLERY